MMAVLVITGLCFCIGYGLALAARQLSPDPDSVTEQINRILPQTQCAQCGYPGCKPYAEAIAGGAARINQCPPGGDEVIRQLACLLDREVLPLDTDFGSNQPESVALIDEAVCVGCTLCIHACPVDAIVGAGKYMHTVIASECTGCELCLPPCPVDCITLIPAKRVPANRAPAQSIRATRITTE